jgi:cell filamentation protein
VHRDWLGETYEWAGEYRRINVAKGNFMFAAAGRVPQLMRAFALGPLREFTPCRFTAIDEQSHALAVVHTELVLIHPFRDGNGRCARLLSVLMGLQAGLPVLDFSGIRGVERRRYFQAVQGGLDGYYGAMARAFRRVIERTLRQSTIV